MHPLAKSDVSYHHDNMAADHAQGLKESMESIVNAGKNRGRIKQVEKLLTDYGLSTQITKQWVDWFSPHQYNVIVDFKGETDSLIYLTAHIDKIDGNLFNIGTGITNGLLDVPFQYLSFTQGALDNASGCSVLLEVAKYLHRRPVKPRYSYRLLFAAAEENGLRGSRLHVASLKQKEFDNICCIINVDCVGDKKASNNFLTAFDYDGRFYYMIDTIVKKINISMPYNYKPAVFGFSDHSSFSNTGFVGDFGKSLLFNAVGGAFLPQRSYFARPKKKKEVPVIYFASDNTLSAQDFASQLSPVAFGNIHSFRDNLKRMDVKKLYEVYTIIEQLIENMENNG